MKKVVICVLMLLCAVSARADTQTRYPAGDGGCSVGWNIVPSSPATLCDKVDDPAGSPDGFTTYLANYAGGVYALFSFSAFTVPAGAVIDNIAIHYNARWQTYSGSAGGSLQVGGSRYDDAAALTAAWADYASVWTTNPSTGSAWTVDDVNGTGPNPLQLFGVYGLTANSWKDITQVYAVVTYTPPAVHRDAFTLSGD